jgi:hypothetical protein
VAGADAWGAEVIGLPGAVGARAVRSGRGVCISTAIRFYQKLSVFIVSALFSITLIIIFLL